MSVTTELVKDSRDAVNRHIMYLLEPDVIGLTKGSDAKLKELYNIWRADCHARYGSYKQEMVEMPPNDNEHFLCRRMAAVIIQRNIFGEGKAESYLPSLINQMKASTCYTHPYTCSCHILKDWTYGNYDLVNSLLTTYLEKEGSGARADRVRMACSGVVAPYIHNLDKCVCCDCYRKRVANNISEAYIKHCKRASDKALTL